MLTIAVLGTGSIGTRHLNVLQSLPEVRVLAIPVRSERRANLVEHRPRGLVAPETCVPLELKRRDPLLVASEKEDRPEPGEQRNPCPMEDRPCRDRALVTATAALLQPPRRDPRARLMPAIRADKTFRPAPPAQRVPAGLLIRKGCLELMQSRRKSHHGVLHSRDGEHRAGTLCQTRSRAERVG